MVHHWSIGIPLDICNLWIVGEEGVNEVEHEVLNLWICHIENHLCAATSQDWLATWSLDNPVRMSLIEFRHGI